MDGTRFDDWTRALASGSSRRRVLGALAGGLAAALGGRRAVRADHKADHCAKAGQKAHPHKPCCPPLVASGADGRCEAPPVVGMCWDDDDDAGGCVCLNADGPCEPIVACDDAVCSGPCTCL